MARTQNKSNTIKKECLKCKQEKNLTKDFYMSNSPNHTDNRYPVCKKCLVDGLNVTEDTDYYSDEFIEVFQSTLLEMNRPFIYTLYESSVEEAKLKDSELLGLYMKNVLFNFKTLTWKNSEFNKNKNEIIENTNSEIIENKSSDINLDNRNREDVLRMLGYDPFEGENPNDKRHLYNKLVDFLDESTLEDSFKLPTVIEIVKSFNQIDKINMALSDIVSDVKNISRNSGGVKSLIDSKDKMLKTVLALAKDNGISVNHNNNKSKGAGTLSGIIKNLQEKGVNAGEINTFDIETCEGMRQVADISNKSIMDQLMLNENDYVEMIKDQREMIINYENRIIELEEENRLIKIKLKQFE